MNMSETNANIRNKWKFTLTTVLTVAWAFIKMSHVYTTTR